MADRARMPAVNRQVYALLDALLARAGAAEHMLFLNWGYRPVPDLPDWAARPTGDGLVNADHIRLVREAIGPEDLDGCDVLDLGCGRGGTLKVLEKDFRIRRLFGADLSAENVEACRRLWTSLPQSALSRRAQIVDACALPYRDTSLDVVLNLESAGAYPDQAQFLREVARVLRPEGRFLYADILPAEMVQPIKEAAAVLGLACRRERSITANVLAARAHAEPVERRIFTPDAVAAVDRDGVLGMFLDQLRAGQGSAMQRLMRAGQLTYHLLHFQKATETELNLPADLVAALQDRHRRFDQLLALGTSVPALSPANPSVWLPHRQSDAESAGPARLRLFCLPFAGGSAGYYRAWRKQLPAAIALCPVELPGRGLRLGEALPLAMRDLAREMADALRWAIDGPFALFGHSLGALGVYLLARELQEQHGLVPVHLFVSGRHAPHRPGRQGHRHTLDDDALTVELVELGGMAPEILENPELMRLLLPILRADFRLTELYAHPSMEPPLQIPMTAFVGAEDAEVSLEEMDRWREMTAAPFRLEVLAGDHFYLNHAPQRDLLLRRIVAIVRDHCALDAACSSFG